MSILNLKKTEPTHLDKEIDSLYEALKHLTPSDDEYAKIADQIVKLTKLKDETASKKRVSADTLAVICGNLAGIVLIISYEHAHPLMSKALGFVVKPK